MKSGSQDYQKAKCAPRQCCKKEQHYHKKTVGRIIKSLAVRCMILNVILNVIISVVINQGVIAINKTNVVSRIHIYTESARKCISESSASFRRWRWCHTEDREWEKWNVVHHNHLEDQWCNVIRHLLRCGERQWECFGWDLANVAVHHHHLLLLLFQWIAVCLRCGNWFFYLINVFSLFI